MSDSDNKVADDPLSSESDIEDDTLGDIDADEDDAKVIINVGGIRHETLVSTLRSKPRTRLSHLANKYKRRGSNRKSEYFFDRHPGVFNTVMDYYRSGELHVPLDVCGAVVKRELDYWRIDATLIEPCCWTSYSSYIDNQKTLSDFNTTVELEQEQVARLQSLTGWRRKQYKIWMILDHPRSSKLALTYAVASFLFVLASIAGFCIETMPLMYTAKNVTRHCGTMEEVNVTLFTSNWFLEDLDYICTAFFTVELIVRIVFAPNKKQFFKNMMNIIDILALLPLYVQITLELADPDNCLRNHRAVLETIFVLRIIRIFRIFHLVKHYKALKILVHAIKASIQELLMLSIFLFIAMLVFSTLIFYAERREPYGMGGGDFETIPIGFWWSIVTMTTVGYGDVYPQTAMGYVIGALCGVCGVLLLALTIPVLSNNFALFYLHARTREEITKQGVDSRPRQAKKDNGGVSVKNKVSPSGDSGRRDVDRALLVSADSSSVTDESGIMLTNMNAEGGAVASQAAPDRTSQPRSLCRSLSEDETHI